MKATRDLLQSAARTADTACTRQADRHYTSVRLYFSVTVASGTGGLQPVIRAYSKISGSSIEITDGGMPVVSTGLYVYEMQPWPADVPAGNVREVVNRRLPYWWDVIVKTGDSSSYTYSLSAELSE